MNKCRRRLSRKRRYLRDHQHIVDAALATFLRARLYNCPRENAALLCASRELPTVSVGRAFAVAEVVLSLARRSEGATQ
jgi:hypothetical protein